MTWVVEHLTGRREAPASVSSKFLQVCMGMNDSQVHGAHLESQCGRMRQEDCKIRVSLGN